MDEDNLSKYNSVKNGLDEIYDHIAEGTRIRSNKEITDQTHILEHIRILRNSFQNTGTKN